MKRNRKRSKTELNELKAWEEEGESNGPSRLYRCFHTGFHPAG